MHILRCVGSKSCVKYQRWPLKFHTKFWIHTLWIYILRGVKYWRITTYYSFDKWSPLETNPRLRILPSSYDLAPLDNHFKRYAGLAHWAIKFNISDMIFLIGMFINLLSIFKRIFTYNPVSFQFTFYFSNTLLVIWTICSSIFHK